MSIFLLGDLLADTVALQYDANFTSSVYESSSIWLDEHRLKNTRMYCRNKYERDHFIRNSNSTLELEDYYRMKLSTLQRCVHIV